MVGLTAVLKPSFPLTTPNPSIVRFPTLTLNFPSLPRKSQTPKTPKKFLVHADNGNGNSNGMSNSTDTKEREEIDDGFKNNGGDGVDDTKKEEGNGRPRFNMRWFDLFLDPDPDNILAVGLTGVLAWASLQVLGQLFFISLAILLAALKYSFIAALLIFILITLL